MSTVTSEVAAAKYPRDYFYFHRLGVDRMYTSDRVISISLMFSLATGWFKWKQAQSNSIHNPTSSFILGDLSPNGGLMLRGIYAWIIMLWIEMTVVIYHSNISTLLADDVIPQVLKKPRCDFIRTPLAIMKTLVWTQECRNVRRECNSAAFYLPIYLKTRVMMTDIKPGGFKL